MTSALVRIRWALKLLGVSVAFFLLNARWVAAEPETTVSPSEELLGKLRPVDPGSNAVDQRRESEIAMRALLDAPKDTLLDAASKVAEDPGDLYGRRRMLLEQCAERYPEETLTRLKESSARPGNSSAASLVWSVIARNDPERAMSVVQAKLNPNYPGNRERLNKGEKIWPDTQIAHAIGRSWFRRDGIAVLKKLGTLPNAKTIDECLFRGMSEEAVNANDCVALLDWFLGPGRNLSRNVKGYYNWWENILHKAAKQDAARTKEWIEHRFPPKSKLRSEYAAWDRRCLRRVFFHFLAKSNPVEAADWYAAQFADDDRNQEEAIKSCLYVLRVPENDLSRCLRWLDQGRPFFVKGAAWVLNYAGSQIYDDTALKQVAAWLTGMPVAIREKIIIASRSDSDRYDVPFTADLNDKILLQLFPDDNERKGALDRLKSQLKPEQFSSEGAATDRTRIGNEFLLPSRKPVVASNKPSTDAAAQLARQYIAARAGDTPTKRLAGIAALEWLATAPTDNLRAILQAHLEAPSIEAFPDDISVFDVTIIQSWVAKDWRACEQFAWESTQSRYVRRALLIETFKAAAARSPDEVYDRLRKLAEDQLFWADS